MSLSSGQVAFTSVPSSITAGGRVTLGWSGGDERPVTVTLRKGTAENLATVDTLTTGRVSPGSLSWDVPSDLPNGDNYVLEISQGPDSSNYSQLITVTGGSSASSDGTSAFPSATSAAVSTSTQSLPSPQGTSSIPATPTIDTMKSVSASTSRSSPSPSSVVSPSAPSPSPSSSSSSGSSSTNKTNLGLGFGLGIPLLLIVTGLVFYLIWRRRSSQRAPPPAVAEHRHGKPVADSFEQKKDATTVAEIDGEGPLPELAGLDMRPELHDQHLREMS